MKQISQSYRTGKLTLAEVALPRAPFGGILVETAVSLISAGTERSIVGLARRSLVEKARERPDLVAKVIGKAKREGILAAVDAVRAKLDNPVPLGYSLAGKVAAVGRGVTAFARGDRIACAGAGFANHAEANAIPVNLAVPIPDEVTDEQAAFITVGAIALHGVRLVAPQLGEVVAVIGLGLIGQLTVSLLAAHGCDVVGIDVDREKCARAMARGAVLAVTTSDDPVEAVRAASRGGGADSIVITASSSTNDPLVLAGDLARDRARISVVGLMPLEIPRKAYFDKELEVIVSRSYGPGRYDANYEERGQDYPIGYVRWTENRNLAAVLRAIATKRLDVQSLITHRFDFERALDAYALITADKPEPHLGVLLTYRERAATGAGALPIATRPPRARRPGAPVGIAVVGTGSFATSVLLPKLTAMRDAKVLVTVSARGLSARTAADKAGTDRVASDLDDVLAMDDIDAVVIATRHQAHAAQAARSLDAGRDVFVEKPAAIDEEQLVLLGEAVRRSHARLLVGYNRRFSPFAQRVREAFAGRAAGLVMTARINAGRIPPGHWIREPTEGGGRVIGEVCHFVDLLSYWAGAPPVRVSAHALGGSGGFERADNLVASITFADGSVGTIVYTAMGDPRVSKERYEVFGEGKVAVLDDFRTLEITANGKTKTTRTLRADKGHEAELRAFVAACATSAPSPIAWPSIEATTRATFAIDHAWRECAMVEIE